MKYLTHAQVMVESDDQIEIEHRGDLRSNLYVISLGKRFGQVRLWLEPGAFRRLAAQIEAHTAKERSDA